MAGKIAAAQSEDALEEEGRALGIFLQKKEKKNRYQLLLLLFALGLGNRFSLFFAVYFRNGPGDQGIAGDLPFFFSCELEMGGFIRAVKDILNFGD